MPRLEQGVYVADLFSNLRSEKMNASKILVSAIATATVAGVVGLSYAQTSTSPSGTSSGAISDTGKNTKPPSANETPGPSTNTQTAPSGSGPNSTGAARSGSSSSTTGSTASGTGSSSGSMSSSSPSSTSGSMSSSSPSSRSPSASSG